MELRQGVKVIAVLDFPGCPEYCIVGAHCDGFLPFVTWLCRISDNFTSSGWYCQTEEEMLEDMGSVEMQHVIRRHLREENPPPPPTSNHFHPFSRIRSRSNTAWRARRVGWIRERRNLAQLKGPRLVRAHSGYLSESSFSTFAGQENIRLDPTPNRPPGFAEVYHDLAFISTCGNIQNRIEHLKIQNIFKTQNIFGPFRLIYVKYPNHV